MIDIGESAPDFTLDNQDGEPVRLSDHRGKRVVLYFYPEADTPGQNPHSARLTFG
jgi:peroxiredoxin Q/BCP